MSKVRNTGGNLLLSMLPWTAAVPEVHEEEHQNRDVLITPEESPAFIFFPHRGAVCSIVRSTASGQMVEAGVVGSEGVLNLHTVLTAPAPTGTTAVVQNEGRFSRIEAAQVRELFDEYPEFRNAVLGYASMFLDQVTQNLVCNRLHPIEQRLSKWLLLMADRVMGEELHVTQDFLSFMLGVHRPSVSIAVNALKEDGLISHRRNWIHLSDREAVVERSCECYRPLREKLRRFTTTLQ